MDEVQLFSVGLYRAILRGDASIAKYCLSCVWKADGGKAYLEWRLPLITCKTNFYLIDKVLEVTKDGLTGASAWQIVYALASLPKARDAFALALMAHDKTLLPSKTPFEVSVFLNPDLQWNDLAVPDLLFEKTATKLEALIYLSASFLKKVRTPVDYELETPQQVPAPSELPNWVFLTEDLIEVTINRALSKLVFDIMVHDYCEVEEKEYSIYAPSVTDNILWPMLLERMCNRLSVTYKDCRIVWEGINSEYKRGSGTMAEEDRGGGESGELQATLSQDAQETLPDKEEHVPRRRRGRETSKV